ncbi:MAG: LysR family transcriptional regulator [Pseudomonadota bacterium]
MSNRTLAVTGDRLDLVETFIAIVDAGGIGAAARGIGATQPTVSRRLQQLEGMLGAKLVERGPQGLSLTAVGAQVLPEARELAARWEGLTELVRVQLGAEAGALSGRVRVVSCRSLGAAFLPPIIADFMAQHPDVRVDLRFEDVSDGAAELKADGCDFAIRAGKHPVGPGEASREIARTRRALCASPEAAERIGFERGVAIARCEPLALEGAGLIHMVGAQPEALRFFGRNSETLEVGFEPIASFDDLEAALDLTLAGAGLGLLPTWRIAPLVEEGLLVSVAGEWVEGDAPVNIHWSPSRFRSAAATALLETVSGHLAAALQEM